MESKNIQKAFNWTGVGSFHQVLEAKAFYGLLSLRYENGRIVLVKIEETIKPSIEG